MISLQDFNSKYPSTTHFKYRENQTACGKIKSASNNRNLDLPIIKYFTLDIID